MSKEIIPLNDVAYAINNLTNKDSDRAIILLMLSGMKATNIRKLTIDDLLKSCSCYFDADEDISLEELISKDPIKEQIIPLWSVEDSSQLLCSSPDSLFFIFRHLQMRINNGRLQLNDVGELLLVNKTYTQLDRNYVTNWLNNDFNKLLNKNKTSDNETHFTGGNLINTFYSACKEYLPRDQYRDSTIKIFKGQKMSNKWDRNHYNAILEDNSILIERYKYVLKHLDLKLDFSKFQDGEYDNASPSIDKRELPNRLESSKIKDLSDVRVILNKHYKEHVLKDKRIDYDEYNRLMDVVMDSATYYYNRGKFEDSYLFLNALFKKAQLKILFEDHKGEITAKTYSQHLDDNFKQVLDELYDIGVQYIVSIDEEYLKERMALYFGHLDQGYDVLITYADVRTAMDYCIGNYADSTFDP